MLNETDKQKKIDKIRRLIDQARRARDEDTVKALGETMFDLTGVKEPEFATEESSGNPKLDKLRKHLAAAISARDDECEANLREMIAETEKEMEPDIPEVSIELTEEPAEEFEMEDEIENPFDPQDAELTPFVAEDYTDEEVESLDPIIEDVLIADMMKDVLMATQIAALEKAGLSTEEELRQYLPVEGDKLGKLCEINGIGKASAKTILETLGYGD